ncbi:hypothetical protein B0H13DRAFT_2364267 [Mycena leptocephala]|nr:hypothetical protein B0H13DRAFT_2364267 [Mycena leptocephala]
MLLELLDGLREGASSRSGYEGAHALTLTTSPFAIDILVHFRDTEAAQGGERSLATILYLMGLTEEARAVLPHL